MTLYGAILLLSGAFPLLLSFDRKVAFYRLWRSIFPALIITGALYLTADIVFARKGIWGFNPVYHSSTLILGLPLEEWLFFVVIPYCCLFIHYVFIAYFPSAHPGRKSTRSAGLLLVFAVLLVIALKTDRAYTFFNFLLMALSLVVAIMYAPDVLSRYFVTFLVILIPFFITNLILTGSFIDGEVVWYNNEENLGIRILTVPIEDIGYAFSLVLINLLFTEMFEFLYRGKGIANEK